MIYGSVGCKQDEERRGTILLYAIAEPQHRESLETQARFAKRQWPGARSRIYERTVRADDVSFPMLVLIVREQRA